MNNNIVHTKTPCLTELRPNQTPFEIIFNWVCSQENSDTVQGKIKCLNSILEILDQLNSKTDTENIINIAGSCFSLLASAMSVSLAVGLSGGVGAIPLLGWVLGTGSIASFGLSTVGVIKKTPEIKAVNKIETALRVLRDRTTTDWGCIWELFGDDFVNIVNQAASGKILNTKNADEEIICKYSSKTTGTAIVIDIFVKRTGIPTQEVVEKLREIKAASVTVLKKNTTLDTQWYSSNYQQQLSTKIPVTHTIDTQIISFDNQSQFTITSTLANSIIVGVPGAGKGIYISNKLESIKGKATVFYIDPKDDQKETGYFKGRVHHLFRQNILDMTPEEVFEWLRICLKQFDAFDAGAGRKLLCIDELAAIYKQIKQVQGAEVWFKGRVANYASSGDSRGIVIWCISQNAHVSGIGLDGGDRSIFRPTIIINGNEISASEQILAAKIIPSDKKLNSTAMKALCSKSKINRAIFDGESLEWYPMPVLPNLCGFDRDSRTFIEPQIQDAAPTRIQNHETVIEDPRSVKPNTTQFNNNSEQLEDENNEVENDDLNIEIAISNDFNMASLERLINDVIEVSPQAYAVYSKIVELSKSSNEIKLRDIVRKYPLGRDNVKQELIKFYCEDLILAGVVVLNHDIYTLTNTKIVKVQEI